jgi:hypothetical protein
VTDDDFFRGAIGNLGQQALSADKYLRAFDFAAGGGCKAGESILPYADYLHLTS